MSGAPAASRMEDGRLEQFIRCPGCFYSGGNCQESERWRESARTSADRIIREFYGIDASRRTADIILERLEMYLIGPEESGLVMEDYLRMKKNLAKYLILALFQEEKTDPPLFLFETLSVQVEELDLELVMHLHVGEWANGSYTLKRYYLDEDWSVVKAYLQLSLVFAYKAFGRLPGQIEAYNLLTGEAYRIRPKMDDLQASMDFLRLTDTLMREHKRGRIMLA
ncbi:hypothetical protein [Paenibacillus chitinolyticus]|uniref:hypothetical protein n=1 Tax=Paenibacillus chitinolyticus TaxID=79263 RepID=UPI00366BA269